MKTEQYKNLEKKYFSGESSQEEEKFLKNQDEDGLFHVLKNEKKETMDWDFDDFLSKIEDKNEQTPIIPLQIKKKTTQKFWWAAAAVAVLLGVYFGNNALQNNNINHQEENIAQEVIKQKNDFNDENAVAVNDEIDSITIKNDHSQIDSTHTKKIAEQDVLDKILPTKGRIKKQGKKKYVYNDNIAPKTNNNPVSEYQSNYVIINGHKVTSEKEAIEITKYSFQVITDKVSKTIANTATLDYSSDY